MFPAVALTRCKARSVSSLLIDLIFITTFWASLSALTFLRLSDKVRLIIYRILVRWHASFRYCLSRFSPILLLHIEFLVLMTENILYTLVICNVNRCLVCLMYEEIQVECVSLDSDWLAWRNHSTTTTRPHDHIWWWRDFVKQPGAGFRWVWQDYFSLSLYLASVGRDILIIPTPIHS